MAAVLRRGITSSGRKQLWVSHVSQAHCYMCGPNNPHNTSQRQDFSDTQPRGMHILNKTYFLDRKINWEISAKLRNQNFLYYRHFDNFAPGRYYSQDSSHAEHNEKSPGAPETNAEEEAESECTESDVGKEEYTDADFRIFYVFPYIRLIRLMCRMKLYQTGFTALVCPLMTAGYLNGAVPLETLQSTVAITAVALAMLYSTSYFTRRFIGMMLLSKDQQVVKLSHLTFFGNRHDVIVPVSDVVPMSELSGGAQLVRLEAYVDSEQGGEEEQETDKTLAYFFCSLQYGIIVNEDDYRHVFGAAA